MDIGAKSAALVVGLELTVMELTVMELTVLELTVLAGCLLPQLPSLSSPPLMLLPGTGRPVRATEIRTLPDRCRFILTWKNRQRKLYFLACARMAPAKSVTSMPTPRKLAPAVLQSAM